MNRTFLLIGVRFCCIVWKNKKKKMINPEPARGRNRVAFRFNCKSRVPQGVYNGNNVSGTSRIIDRQTSVRRHTRFDFTACQRTIIHMFVFIFIIYINNGVITAGNPLSKLFPSLSLSHFYKTIIGGHAYIIIIIIVGTM